MVMSVAFLSWLNARLIHLTTLIVTHESFDKNGEFVYNPSLCDKVSKIVCCRNTEPSDICNLINNCPRVLYLHRSSDVLFNLTKILGLIHPPIVSQLRAVSHFFANEFATVAEYCSNLTSLSCNLLQLNV